MTAIETEHEPGLKRFNVSVDGELAGHTDYEPAGDGVYEFNHTEVLPEFQGQGLSKPLIAAALDTAREEGWKVRPVCSAVAGFIEKFPHYADLVAD